MRDPRDLVVSDYFSMKYSHPIKNEYFAEWRYRLNHMDEREGLISRIQNMDWNYYEPLRAWAQLDCPQVRLVRFEDFFGENQRSEAKSLLQHLDLSVSAEKLGSVLDTMDFKKKSQGRTAGLADEKKHYRKGASGDWKNYFDDQMIEMFMKKTGDLLQVLGYAAS
jgi:hypothetical protein